VQRTCALPSVAERVVSHISLPAASRTVVMDVVDCFLVVVGVVVPMRFRLARVAPTRDRPLLPVVTTGEAWNRTNGVDVGENANAME